MTNVRAARRYAMALMSVAGAQNTVEKTGEDLASILADLRGSRELRLLVASPIVPEKKKIAVFQELFGTRVEPATITFLHLLVEKKREPMLLDIIEHYGMLRDEKLGVVNVDVMSTVNFTELQERELRASLEHYTRKKVRLRFSLDGTLKGGFVVRIGDTVLDASIRHQLERLRERFLNMAY